MKKSVGPSMIKGTIKAPASKSMMQRAIAAALLAETPTRLLNPTYSDDSRAALSVIRRLGATVEAKEHEIRVHCQGGMKPTGEILHCGESGLGIRMFSSIAALCREELTLTGKGSLLKRPVSMIEQPLNELGVEVTTSSGCPPLTVKGPLKGGTAHVDGSVSSQVLTGLLMALPRAPGDSRLYVKNLKSTPYIDMTIALMKAFGVEVQHTNYETFFIRGRQTYSIEEYEVEGDWSGASFLLVAGAVGGSVTVTNLDINSRQADRRIIDALKVVGAGIKMTGNAVEVVKSELRAFQFDATHCPDLFPPLVVLACNCKGTSLIRGVERLIHKESNRATALQKEFTALGGVIRISGNQMEIDEKKLKGGTIDSHNDHRIAMAGALAAINAESEVIIRDYECVAKSYPDFFEDFRAIGGEVNEL
ncbi:MAG: 3-phosphoshikimate 1-carboxyvinyltransferase [Candidatus Aminicenantes bacterium]|nr:3-phosphoshikimate 1-carboxyvinyltransferase [Candidatus Aminicenantes bacterium]NIM83204.1 3-phosphoshikimate 1-carboxyvinyltransferase [Candidatus Aminicenantes bacterium]NIN22590.1 3-phosphoshikimate 1-carboxyvinyltransferase [Candidatus Aminicenantes bacterium]NIN46352.1 3-phosphoshikimate 1-carboxyvinyltransferase [Candidatus Aminicenantes bacterium]NIN89200.1 3-phosphoshikimate 1-carboxyvinyltransferase [Candidatus Aminicenantes bacterium]